MTTLGLFVASALFATATEIPPVEAEEEREAPPARNNLGTVLAIGATSYVSSALIHEGVGHGFGCLIGGGTPMGFSTAVADCVEDGTPAGHRWDVAGGAGANLLAGVGFAAPLLWAPPKNGADYYFLWLSSTVNLLHAWGYLMVGPWVPVGDFGTAGFLRDMDHRLPWQIGLSTVGTAMVFGTVGFSNRLLEPLLGIGDDRNRRRALLCLVPYFAGATLVTGSALLSRLGPMFAVTAGVANFAGTLFLAYIPLFFTDDVFRFGPAATEEALSVQRSPLWVAAGVTSVVLGVGVFGPGVGPFPEPHPFDPFN